MCRSNLNIRFIGLLSHIELIFIISLTCLLSELFFQSFCDPCIINTLFSQLYNITQRRNMPKKYTKGDINLALKEIKLS